VTDPEERILKEMNFKNVSSGYIRFSYWVEPQEFSRLERELGSKFAVSACEKVVCETLRHNIQIGYALPGTWNLLCKRQSSWYRASPKADKVLLVSSFELGSYGLNLETVILSSNFKPPCVPSIGDQLELVNSSRYQSMRPSEWEDVSEQDRDRIIRQARTAGVRDSIEHILLSSSANHANFLDPRYFVQRDFEKVPYSIGKSGNVCSACLEFFNIIGSEFQTKMVVPCIGAVLYAGMCANGYYEVKNMAFSGDKVPANPETKGNS
jgi:hypothetical protein